MEQIQKPKHSKITSRKLWLSQEIIILAIAVPIIFKNLEISESTTLMVLGLIGAVGGFYGIVNTIDKKWGGEG